jgi:anhydro-N-acetylmuramic acid kinase
MLAIGLMSGTSLDGVDAALVEILDGKFNLLKFVTLPYEKEFKSKIMRNLSDETAKLSEISSLNFELSYKFVEGIDLLLEGTNYKYSDIEFVASHGQTIWHDPKGDKYPKDRIFLTKQVPSTLQIGSASYINYKTGIKVISNFRVKDICAGGEGAPLVPFSEYYLYKSDEKNIVFQNIGGISNLTYIKKQSKISDIISFDNGVGNIMIDYFVNKYFDLPYDKDGEIALSGKVISEIFEYLLKDEYIYLDYPKSTGREKFSSEYMEDLATKLNFHKYNKKDIITTISEFTAYGISYSYNNLIKDIDLAIISGGGSHNKYIMKRLKEMTGIDVISGDEAGINSDAKEALAFVVLGYRTINKESSNVPSATGAKEEVILGDITI